MVLPMQLQGIKTDLTYIQQMLALIGSLAEIFGMLVVCQPFMQRIKHAIMGICSGIISYIWGIDEPTMISWKIQNETNYLVIERNTEGKG